MSPDDPNSTKNPAANSNAPPAGGGGTAVAPTTTTTAENPYQQFHVVKSGDTLSKIAADYYGDASLYPKIFEANRDILQDPNKIKPGQKLRLP